MNLFKRSMGCLTLLALLFLSFPITAHADTDARNYINQNRSSSLKIEASTQKVVQSWVNKIASDDKLATNPSWNKNLPSGYQSGTILYGSSTSGDPLDVVDDWLADSQQKSKLSESGATHIAVASSKSASGTVYVSAQIMKIKERVVVQPTPEPVKPKPTPTPVPKPKPKPVEKPVASPAPALPTTTPKPIPSPSESTTAPTKQPQESKPTAKPSNPVVKPSESPKIVAPSESPVESVKPTQPSDTPVLENKPADKPLGDSEPILQPPDSEAKPVSELKPVIVGSTGALAGLASASSIFIFFRLRSIGRKLDELK